MQVLTETLSLKTQGETDLVDITRSVRDVLQRLKVQNGTVTIFLSGSTAGVTTIEYEPGLIGDSRSIWEKLIPTKAPYAHNRAGEDNGHSHLRASLLGPSLTVPIVDGKLSLGPWQQIVLIDFDTRPRQRTVLLQFIGE